jgi:hypothetical protein
MGRRHLLCVLAALSGAACAPDAPCGLHLCDVRDADCQRMAAEAAACLRGVDPIATPVAVVSRADFVSQAATSLTADQEESFRRWNAGLAALGLAPIDNTPAANGAASAGQIGGVYSATDKQITVVDDGYPLDDWPWIGLLVHENVHAIQDARFNLAALSASHATDLDHALALGSVTEGEATYVEDLADAGFFGLGASDIPWPSVLQNWQDWARAQAHGSPRPVTLSWLHFRYPFGTGFVKGALDAGDWAGVDGLFAAPPGGTREVMAGFGAIEPAGGPWTEDLGADAVPVLGDSYDYVGTDRMGAWLFQAFVDRLNAYGDVNDLPPFLRGDALSVFQDRNTGGAVAVWRLRLAPSSSPYDLYFLYSALSGLPAAQAHTWANDIIIVAASDADTLSAVSLGAFQPISPQPTSSPMTAHSRWGCALPVR